ncbi:MAG: hypothetical protein IPK13_18475 [Deltaproteobacteria bacterium]|nr:hypothetical protein [Deltaproteobacteria bacterium]
MGGRWFVGGSPSLDGFAEERDAVGWCRAAGGPGFNGASDRARGRPCGRARVWGGCWRLRHQGAASTTAASRGHAQRTGIGLDTGLGTGLGTGFDTDTSTGFDTDTGVRGGAHQVSIERRRCGVS